MTVRSALRQARMKDDIAAHASVANGDPTPKFAKLSDEVQHPTPPNLCRFS